MTAHADETRPARAPGAAQAGLARRLLLPVGLGLTALVGGAIWLLGQGYYRTDLWDRAEYPGHALWRSSGAVGHGLGIVGAALLLVNLSFLARRHWARLRGLGRLRTWLDVHVVTGALGPMLILFHSTFAPRTTVAIVSASSLGVLVLTGVVGRFIYTLVPHTVTGVELSRAELDRRLAAAREAIHGGLGPSHPMSQALERLGAPPRWVPRTKLGCLVALPALLAEGWLSGARARRLVRRLRRSSEAGAWADAGSGRAAPSAEAAAELAARFLEGASILRRLHTLSVGRRLLRSWRSVHRVFAVLMIVTMIVHVTVALYFGYDGGVL